MEAVKLSRRRISNLDCDGYRPMKRRLNGMCHLEGGGNWHMNLLPEKTSPTTNPTSTTAAAAAAAAAAAGYLADVKPQPHQLAAPQPTSKQPLDFNHHHHQQQQHHPNGPEGQVQAPPPTHHQANNPSAGGPPAPPPPGAAALPPPPLLEPSQQQQHLPSMAHPVLPPSLRESERMQSVERWINSIPLDAPIYVQTSLTQIVPISDPKSFPDELSVSDHIPSAPNNASSINAAGDTSRGGVGNYDYYSQQSQVGGYGSGGGGGGGGVTSRGNTTTASTSGNPHLAPPPPHHPSGGGGAYHPRAYHGGSGGQPPLHPPPPPHHPGPADNQGIRARSFTRGPPNRFFNDYETQFVVKLFRDFFANGSCPSLNEVRRRMAHSQLQGRRNANSVRAKVKRLQASGRWKDYEIM